MAMAIANEANEALSSGCNGSLLFGGTQRVGACLRQKQRLRPQRLLGLKAEEFAAQSATFQSCFPSRPSEVVCYSLSQFESSRASGRGKVHGRSGE